MRARFPVEPWVDRALVRKLAMSAAIMATSWLIELGGYVSSKGHPAGEGAAIPDLGTAAGAPAAP